MVVGIVAEYNPFHNGHKLQIEYARNVLGADHVIVAMSGSFTQRGEIACFDKYTRAHTALKCGADIVLEIPTIFSTSSAREFASAGVQLLRSTGIVDTLLFSAECDDRDLFIQESKKLVELENSGEINDKINILVAHGISYATARSQALKDYISEEIISSPNNILGMEYSRYIFANNLPMNIAVMKRQGNDYNDLSLSGELSSATSIREHYKLHQNFVAVPEEALPIYENSCFIKADDISEMLHYKLLICDSYTKYLDCNSDLSDRITSQLKDYVSFSQFCDLLKTKNMNHTRISRVLCHILLNITQEDFSEAKAKGYITYLRMLGFSKKGSKLLKEIKKNATCPLLTAPDETVDIHDILASDIYRAAVTEKTKKSISNEFNRKFDLVNI